MFFSRTHIIAIVTLTSLLTACGGDGESSGVKLKSVGPNQTKVFKSDGSTQCEGAGIPPDEMRLELAKAGIDVICAQKAHNGMNYPAVCGGGTGNINVYVIHSSNLPDAEKLGFKSVQELPDYKDKACTN
ncbi:MAG: hypothetical protein AAGC78_12995 [Cellvibrio sp.]|uniref:hypothetical protein n=1 Tax=Cellvibrio sp. TaxID=1965322 RepID=UPI0031AE5844